MGGHRQRFRAVRVLLAVGAAAAAAAWIGNGFQSSSNRTATIAKPEAATEQPAGTSLAVYRERASSTINSADLGETINLWAFSAGVPGDWLLFPDAKTTRTDKGLNVVTNTRAFGYQLWSDAERLPAGRYAAVLDGAILHGGVQLGILTYPGNEWVANEFFWRGSAATANRRQATTFELQNETRVRVVLANWAPLGGASTWALDEVRIVRWNESGPDDLESAQLVRQVDLLAPTRAPDSPQLRALVPAARQILKAAPSAWDAAEQVRLLVRRVLPLNEGSARLATAFVEVARAAGLPVRLVVGTASARNLYDSHTTVEVWDRNEGRWIVSDPTFGGHWTSGVDGDRLGVVGLSRLVRQGKLDQIYFHSSGDAVFALPAEYYVDPLIFYSYVAVRAYADGSGVYVVDDPTAAPKMGVYRPAAAGALADTPPDHPLEVRPAPTKLGAPRGFTSPPRYADRLLHEQTLSIDGAGETIIEVPPDTSQPRFVEILDSDATWTLRQGASEYALDDVADVAVSPVLGLADQLTLQHSAVTETVRIRVWTAPTFPDSRTITPSAD